MIYGYVRISTKKQSLQRQIDNIKALYPKAVIFEEVYTGTKIESRKHLNLLLKRVKQGDTIVFDSVSRMSRDAQQGIDLYMELYSKGINLVFLKESYINTDVYKQALSTQIEEVGNEIADIYIQATNKVLMLLAKKQIQIAFDQAQKEVQDLQQRTKEGLEQARLKGKQIGREQGKKVVTKKSIKAKQDILQLSKDFKGSYTDKKVMELLGISNNTYYKYKKELIAELTAEAGE